MVEISGHRRDMLCKALERLIALKPLVASTMMRQSVDSCAHISAMALYPALTPSSWPRLFISVPPREASLLL